MGPVVSLLRHRLEMEKARVKSGTRAGVHKENVTMADGALLAWRQQGGASAPPCIIAAAPRTGAMPRL